MSENGVPNFTHTLKPFVLEGITFRRVKIPAQAWAETLARVSESEQVEMSKKKGSVLFGVSAAGLYDLCALGVHPDDRPQFTELWEKGLLEFGELVDLRDWLWEEITARPFTSATHSSDGPGSSSEASSRVESSSPVEVQTA